MHPIRLGATLLVAATAAGCQTRTPTEAPSASHGLQASEVPPGFGGGLVARFDAARGEVPEGITLDHRGNLYVGLQGLGEIRKLTPAPTGGSHTQEVYATLDAGLLGLAADPAGNVYAAVASFRAATHGVWRITPDGHATRLAGTAQIFFPNALTFDPRGTLYVTSSSGAPVSGGAFRDGEIWRIPDQGNAELWLRDPLLTGTNVLGPPFPIGANGIAFTENSLVVANTEKGFVARIPIDADGTAGTPTVLASGFTFLDGLAVDVLGNIYLLVIGASKLVRVSADGSAVTDLAGPLDGVDFATSLVFGTGRGDRRSVFLANVAGFPSPLPDRPGPSVLKVDVDIPGMPTP